MPIPWIHYHSWDGEYTFDYKFYIFVTNFDLTDRILNTDKTTNQDFEPLNILKINKKCELLIQSYTV